MKKIILILVSIGLLSTFGFTYSGSYSYGSSDDNYDRKKYDYNNQPGDDRYLDRQQNNTIYGNDNALGSSKPGDDDYSEREMNYLLND